MIFLISTKTINLRRQQTNFRESRKTININKNKKDNYLKVGI